MEIKHFLQTNIFFMGNNCRIDNENEAYIKICNLKIYKFYQLKYSYLNNHTLKLGQILMDNETSYHGSKNC